MFALGIPPVTLLDTHMSFMRARSIMIATRLGVFDALSAGALTAAEVANRCGTSPAATEKLLNALVDPGYLTFGADRYELARVARKWLTRDSPRRCATRSSSSSPSGTRSSSARTTSGRAGRSISTRRCPRRTGAATSARCGRCRGWRRRRSCAARRCRAARRRCSTSADPRLHVGLAVPPASRAARRHPGPAGSRQAGRADSREGEHGRPRHPPPGQRPDRRPRCPGVGPRLHTRSSFTTSTSRRIARCWAASRARFGRTVCA